MATIGFMISNKALIKALIKKKKKTVCKFHVRKLKLGAKLQQNHKCQGTLTS